MQQIIVVGAGAAGLMAAQEYAQKGFSVSVYDQKPAAARKFLVAGHGGFNLTNSEDLETFLTRYSHPEIKAIVRCFTNQDTINWLQEIGIDTYVGSSGKVFPRKGIKPIEVLNAWLRKLEALGVNFHYGYRLQDFDETRLNFSHQQKTVVVPYQKAVFALGGGSWSKTGSDAKWVQLFSEKNIAISPLQSANSGFETATDFSALAGEPLKNIALSYKDEYKKGELVFTHYGIEGNAVYYLNRFVRAEGFPNTIYLDLKPSLSLEAVQTALKNTGKSITDILKKQLKLKNTHLALLQMLDKEVYADAVRLSEHIKRYPIIIRDFRPMEEVISTSGGVCWRALHEDLSLKNYPNIQCVGEMLDWEAPTGGYLLQACFASGYFAAHGGK